MDSDLVVVMDKGRVVECDAPSVLLARGPGGSMFRDLADRWEQEHKAQEASH
jgi:ABC-type multidrug transport system fused ATPase/permease subunit